AYIDDDFPLSFPVPDMGLVRLTTEETVHYPVNGTLADKEWSVLLPKIDEKEGFVHLGPNSRPFTVSMVHSLHCLNIMREALVQAPVSHYERTHLHHCMNYARQMILCAADTRLNPLSISHNGHQGIDGIDLTFTCRDWTVAYRALEEN
ncbi:hypothetical protein BV22DRAFT_983324, partial [Leucogyrophana mollusca]